MNLLKVRFPGLLPIFLLLSGCSPPGEDLPAVERADLRAARQAFSELRQALREEGGQLWNHYLEGPVLLAWPDTRVIIGNERDALEALKRYRKVYVGLYPDDRVIGNTATDWNGKRWAMVQWPLPETRDERLRLLIHESFHCTQPALGFDSLVQWPCNHLDTRDGRLFLRLEMEALKAALRAPDPGPHLHNALLFRLHRHHLFPGARDNENSLEINEGIAEYTGSILCGMDEQVLKEHYASEIDLLYTLPSFIRTFPYFALPVYGYFMKKTENTWNRDITRATNLTDYLCRFFRVSYGKADSAAIEERGAFYSIDSLALIEDEREAGRQRMAASYRDRFLGDSILVIPLIDMEVAFNAKGSLVLDTFGTVYPNLLITDNWGILEVDSGGVLVAREWDHVTVTSPRQTTDTILLGTSWRLRLHRQWTLRKEGANYRLVLR